MLFYLSYYDQYYVLKKKSAVYNQQKKTHNKPKQKQAEKSSELPLLWM